MAGGLVGIALTGLTPLEKESFTFGVPTVLRTDYSPVLALMLLPIVQLERRD